MNLLDDTGIGTITNDDLANVTIDNVTMAEGDPAGSTTFTFTISQSALSSTATMVDYDTSNVTAMAGSDYTAVAITTAMIPAGMTSTTVDVTVSRDLLVEADETFNVNLSNLVAAAGISITDPLGVK